jgi:hypothetical protein
MFLPARCVSKQMDVLCKGPTDTHTGLLRLLGRCAEKFKSRIGTRAMVIHCVAKEHVFLLLRLRSSLITTKDLHFHLPKPPENAKTELSTEIPDHIMCKNFFIILSRLFLFVQILRHRSARFCRIAWTDRFIWICQRIRLFLDPTVIFAGIRARKTVRESLLSLRTGMRRSSALNEP